ncbi:MAG: 4-hydroxythreonine-4-phosphate dehydrogenase PdxA [Alphaproteobacteria bacterium]|nr:4-hydroxythreonine-4-phosphate dehydrogenase PdxA [Alphaproteobacteria bacterium]MCZ6846623.1 4-hydroxythreonine-4-phosphate dehydrogenase PdxA [Alphaproteobacteria bacterium]
MLPTRRENRVRVALPIGDPAGIGPEIVLRTAFEASVQQVIAPVIVGDLEILTDQAQRLGIGLEQKGDTLQCSGHSADFVDCGVVGPDNVTPGAVSALAGRATIAYATAAINLANEGHVDAVLAAPHTERSVQAAGIPFSGYPSLLAKLTQTSPDDVFLMLVSEPYKVVNATLHVALQDAVKLLTTERVTAAIEAAHNALTRMGFDAPRIGVCGLNPHAGEDGLFGQEEIDVIGPSVARCRQQGLNVEGPRPADVLFAGRAHDVYVAMYHDQGHIPVKVAAPRRASAISVGTPILFGSVAHGSALDIAGQGRADPTALQQAAVLLATQFK